MEDQVIIEFNIGDKLSHAGINGVMPYGSKDPGTSYDIDKLVSNNEYWFTFTEQSGLSNYNGVIFYREIE